MNDENRILQEEEAAVLQAIFAEDCSVAENGTSIELRVLGPHGNAGTFPKCELPELTLRVHFPENYPSESLPVVEVEAAWLSPSLRERLWEGMERVGEEGVGEVVVYKWVDWLREQAWLWEAGEGAGEGEGEGGRESEGEGRGDGRSLEEREAEGDGEGEEGEGDAETEEGRWGEGEWEKKRERREEESGGEFLRRPGDDSSREVKEGEGGFMDEIFLQNLDESLGIVHGPPFTERRSTFQAHLAHVASLDDVEKVMQALLSNRKIAGATHNIMAYRITEKNPNSEISIPKNPHSESPHSDNPNLKKPHSKNLNSKNPNPKNPTSKTPNSENPNSRKGFVGVQDYDDDGESAAGGRLLHLLQIVDARDVLLVVSRWFGGVLLGPERFKHINNAGRLLLDSCGYIEGGAKGGRGKKR